jgi:hypothetical protein
MKIIIQDFIKDNNINLDTSDSALNGACVILSGFALYKEINSSDDLIKIIEKILPEIDVAVYKKELSRVFHYADMNNYGKFWETKQAQKEYKF